jgi:hypothetical protein
MFIAEAGTVNFTLTRLGLLKVLEILISSYLHGSRDSSVGIATGYGLDDQGGGEFESW